MRGDNSRGHPVAGSEIGLEPSGDAETDDAAAAKRNRRFQRATQVRSMNSFAPFEQFSEQEFHRQFNTNVLGMFIMIEAACRPSGREAAA